MEPAIHLQVEADEGVSQHGKSRNGRLALALVGPLLLGVAVWVTLPHVFRSDSSSEYHAIYAPAVAFSPGAIPAPKTGGFRASMPAQRARGSRAATHQRVRMDSRPEVPAPPSVTSRRDVLLPLVATAVLTHSLPSHAAPPTAARTATTKKRADDEDEEDEEGAGPVVTDRIFMDIRIIERYDEDVLEDSAVRGQLVFGLFGRDAPLGTKKFLEFVDGTNGESDKEKKKRESDREQAKSKKQGGGSAPGGGPMYSSSSFFRVEPGVSLEGGRINGLGKTSFGGEQVYEFLGKLLPGIKPVLEANDLKHDSRGLLTRKIFNEGPEFEVTVAKAPGLDGTHEVIGQLEGGQDLLSKMEQLPYITGKATQGEGTKENEIYQKQFKFFSDFGKTIGDSRAKDRTGLLLRRVEIVRVGRV